MNEMEKLVLLLAEQLGNQCQLNQQINLSKLQFDHSLARFNDTSSQTCAAQQQAFVNQQNMWFSRMLTGKPE